MDSVSRQLGARKKQSSSSTSPKRDVVLFAIIALAITACCAIFVFSHRDHDEGNTKIHDAALGEDYEALLRRAKALTSKYQELTGRTDLPNDLAPSTTTPQNTGHTNRGNNPMSLRSSAVASASASGAVDLVIGMAQDTDPKNFAVFCKSLRSVSQADAVIFVNKPVPARHAQIAAESRITVVGFELGEVRPSFMEKYHPSTLRWPLFHHYFQEHAVAARYRRVWMIDVRDSFFQADPFAFVPPSATSLHVFSGVESFPIKECGWNSGWINDCFGPAVLADVGSKGIICSGVSVGTVDAVTEYVRTMSDIITGTSSDHTRRFPQCERNGVDQGVHNVLVHTGALDHLHVRRWGQADGPVANMQARMAAISCGKVQGQDNCTVKNKAGVAVAVVHQYDRYPELQQHLFKKYVDWVKTGDLQAEWDYEPACRASYSYRADTDLYKGICDMPHKGGVTSAAACCALCDDRKAQGCQAFTFFAGACYFKTCGRGGGSDAVMKMPGAVSGYLKS